MLSKILSFLRLQVEEVLVVASWLLQWLAVDGAQVAAKVALAAQDVTLATLILLLLYAASALT